jgi:hypothetical protein
MLFLSDLLSFVWAVINSWAGYATGGVIVALVALWFTLRQKQVPRWLGVTLAVIFLVFAFFHAWRGEHRAAIEAQRERQKVDDELSALKRKSLPKLKGQILFSGISRNDPDANNVLFVVSLNNDGAPSITKNWSASIDIPRRGSISGTPVHYRRGFDFLGNGEEGQRLENSDAIYEKTAERPVMEGSEVHGFLVFDFKGIRPEDINRDGAVVRLTFFDIRDHENTITGLLPIGGNSDSLSHIPGIKTQRLLPDASSLTSLR